MARARCVVAEAEVALVSRDLGWPEKALDAARTHARRARRQSERRTSALSRHPPPAADRQPRRGRAPARQDRSRALPPASRTIHELVAAGIAMRRLSTKAARAALARARDAAREARIPALTAEVESAALVLDTPAARLIERGRERPLLLEEVEALLASNALIVDACRHVVRAGDTVVSLATRPVLFALARAPSAKPGRAMPHGMPSSRKPSAPRPPTRSHRARLRVEIGRLRAELRPLAEVNATERGFELAPHDGREIVVLARPADDAHAAVLAFLNDGESWSSSALRPGLGRQPADRAACARRSGSSRQGAIVRSRTVAALDDAAGPRIHDDLVTPGPAARWLGEGHRNPRRGQSHETAGSRDRPRVWALPRRRPGRRRHVRRQECLVRVGRKTECARSRERQGRAFDRCRRPCRHGLRRPASLPDRREAHPEDRPQDRPRAGHHPRAG